MAGQTEAKAPSQDVQYPGDLQAHAALQADPAQRMSDAIRTNPALARNPSDAIQLMNQPYGDGKTVGGASKFLSAYGNAHKSMVDAVKSTDNPHAGGFFSDLLNIGKHVWHGVATAFSPQTMNDSERAFEGAAGNIGTGIEDAAKRFFTTTTELGSFGQVRLGWKGNWPTSSTATNNRELISNYADGLHTVANALNNTINPVQTFRNMAHTIAFTESLVKRRGASYALAYMLPYLALGFATHSVIGGTVGAAGAASAADEAAATSAAGEVTRLASEAEAQGASLTPDEATAVAQAQATQAEATAGEARATEQGATPPPAAEPPAVEPRVVPSRGPVFNAVSKTVNVLTKPLAPVARLAHVLGKPASDIRLNGMYAAANFGIRQDPQYQQLWNATAGGTPYDADGKPITGGVGGVIANYLGLPDGFLHGAIADPINIYANWFGSDYLGAVGRVIGRARSAQGLSGILGRFFGGMGIKDGADVYRTARQYTRVNTAFQWMADHNAGQIGETFKGLFTGEGGKVVLAKLGDATTKEQVMRIWADMAKGVDYANTIAPSMSGYELMKATYKFGDNVREVGSALAEPMDALHAEAADIERETGFKVWPPDSANYALARGVDGSWVRERTILGQGFTKLFSASRMYFNEAAGKMEHAIIHYGSVGAGSAVASDLRALRESEATIAVVGDRLLRATEDEYNNIVLRSYFDALLKLTWAGTRESVLDGVKVQLNQDLADELTRMMGPDGAGEKGVMANGVEGKLLSTVAHDGDVRNAAIGETHLGTLRFPQVRDLKQFSKFVRRMAIEMSNVTDGVQGVDRALSVDSLGEKARFADANLKGSYGDVTSNIERGLGDIADPSGMVSRYHAAKLREVAAAIREATKGIAPDDTIGHNEAFVGVYDAVRRDLDIHEKLLDLAAQMNVLRHTFDSMTSPEAVSRIEALDAQLPEGTSFTSVTNLAGMTEERLHGEMLGLRDAEAALSPRLSRNAISIGDIRAHVDEANPYLAPGAREEMTQRIAKLRADNPRYRNKWQAFIDGVNLYYSRLFVPLALYSGGWAIRVGNSEMLLNTFREGGESMLQSKLLTSVVKHETGRAVFTSKMEDSLQAMLKKDLLKGSFGDMLKRSDLNFEQKVRSSIIRTVVQSILQARDIAGGALHGFEKNLIRWDARTERMVQNYTEAVMDYAPGGLPGGVHGSGGIIEQDGLAKHILVGADKEGRPAADIVHRDRTFMGVNVGHRSYPKALRFSLTRIHDDRILYPGMRKLADLLQNAGDREFVSQTARDYVSPALLAKGAARFRTQTQIDGLVDQMTRSVFDTIENLPEGVQRRFWRNDKEGVMALSHDAVLAKLTPEERELVNGLSPELQARYFAHYDWARTVALHDMNTVMGYTSRAGRVIHPDLVYQATTGQVTSAPELKNLVDTMPKGQEPLGLVSETHYDGDVAEPLMSRFFFQRVADVGFSKALGPMVNSWVRDPVYLNLYDEEMEKLQGLVGNNLVSRDVARVQAHTKAAIRMQRFVHNPMDRTVFETNMRAFAPFYFAQNQAWRRALRVFRDDPGAFEKYLRTCLAATDWVAVQSQNNAAPVHIPGTQFMGAIAGLGHGFQNNVLGSLSFSLSGSVGSISSVIPTGAESGMGVLENIARPSWGPLVTLPFKEIQHFLVHVPFAEKAINTILGPIAANSSMFSEIAPSTWGRNFLGALESALGDYQTSGVLANTSGASAYIYTLNNAVDDKAKTYYDQFYREVKAAGGSNALAEKYARAYADKEISKFFDVKTNSRQIQEFMDQVHMASVFMMVTKAALSFGSPLALSIQESFSKDPQFQALLNEKNAAGQPKYTFQEAATLFAEKYPTHIYDLVAHSMPTGSDYPETKSAMNLINNHPDVVSRYPIAAAYVINRDTAYSPQAYQLEIGLRLRERYGLTGGASGYGPYYDALQVAAGNDWYYNWLSPQYNTNAAGEQGYKNYEELTKAAQAFGRFANPTWYGQFQSGAGKWAQEAAAVGQMAVMLKDKSVPNSVFGGAQEREAYTVILDSYYQTAQAYQSASTSHERFTIEQDWYQKMTDVGNSIGGVITPALAYFITSVLRNLPTAKENPSG